MKFGVDQHLSQMLLWNFRRSRSEFKVKTTILQSYSSLVRIVGGRRHCRLAELCTWWRWHPKNDFLLLVRYIPNAAKRSIWDECTKKYYIDDRPTHRPTDRPTAHLAHIREISNGHISARGSPIHFMFGSTVGFSGSADRMALFPVSPNPRWRLHLEKFKWQYLRGGSSDLLRVWL